MLAYNVRVLCRCGIIFPSASNRSLTFDKVKYLKLMFGDIGQARTKARICRIADCYNLKPQFHKTRCVVHSLFCLYVIEIFLCVKIKI